MISRGSRIEELRQVTRSRAADNFAMIRARVEELRHSVLRYRPTRRGVRRLSQGRIMGRLSVTPRINPIGSCRVQLSSHLSAKDAAGPEGDD